MINIRGYFALLCVALSTAGCREPIPLFEAKDRQNVDEDPRRLTYSPGDDRSPAWSAGSDSVYYSAEPLDGAETGAVLMSVYRDGSSARLLPVSSIGIPSAPPLMEPAVAFHGSQRLAFLEMRPLLADMPCAADTIVCASAELPSPLLEEAWLVTSDGSSSGLWERLLLLAFPGGAEATGETVDGVPVYETRHTPQQVSWTRMRSLPSKPDWHPDGASIAVADGLGIHVVDVESGDVGLLVDGDASNPAWSPDGMRLAFDRVQRVDSIADACLYSSPDPKSPGELIRACLERRTLYETTPPAIVVLELDGLDETEIDHGADPAWDPHGRFLVYVTEDGIVRHDLASSNAELLPGTGGGLEPAISPDARWLAFSRFDPELRSRDIWVVALD